MSTNKHTKPGDAVVPCWNADAHYPAALSTAVCDVLRLMSGGRILVKSRVTLNEGVLTSWLRVK